MSIAIPEGYELLAGRNRKNAKKALSIATDRGFPEQTVLTHPEGYLIPTGVDAIETEPGTEGEEPLVIEGTPIDLPPVSASKGDLEAFAAEHGVDLTEAKNNEDRHAAIKAWADSLPELTAEPQKEN